jgi:hypothetical protein
LAGLTTFFGNHRGTGPKQQLSAHLGEARTAKFMIERVKYARHDRTSRLIIAAGIILRHLPAYKT